MRHLSLFTGAGGGELGAILNGWETIGYVEIDDYCQRVIRARIDDGILPNAPIFGDIRAFIGEGYAESYQGMVDVLSAGFPCQPHSVAGKRLGAEDERDMWPATEDVIRIIQPRQVLLENVPGIRKYLPVVIRDLRRLSYTVRRPLQLGADDVGHIHRRKRIWVYATNSDSERCGAEYGDQREDGELPQPNGQTNKRRRQSVLSGFRESSQADVTDANGQRKQQLQRGQCDEWGRTNNEMQTTNYPNSGGERGEGGWTQTVCVQPRLPWSKMLRSVKDLQGGPDIPEPLLWGMDARLANRLDRTHAIGNGQVSLCAAVAWRILSEMA